ncbi:NAD-dependent aldehyde dehydrogenase [Frankia canadensis]|uniref:NAD-dependent aldehyde dehydrogenase n=1 Tax=Frankia canadensis TaxID=1836972 RepID=A0A2I2KJ22_9ACTN|nr:aldehyde dehydrogenase family protein [Frankia canadensis]SNQ45668.1 NAD-dependent aldehyde dehydrogenase [Frankia canadensis]SOU52958.1 NAD-dependent aldehyde dehydrogenase [Frankia canadensis]
MATGSPRPGPRGEAGLIAVDALGPGGPYHSRTRLTITDLGGTAVAELSLVPSLYVHRAIGALRAAEPLPAAERLAALARAGEMFATEPVGGLAVDDYERAVCRISGMPISVVRHATRTTRRALVDAGRDARQALPTGSVADWHDPATVGGRAVWTRRGEVFGVHAAGNHPGVHALWPQALALGYRVAVRPSRREPLTPFRLVSALRAAGFADDQVVLLPTDHTVADEIIKAADLSLVYGGDDVVRKYGDDPTVLVQGPGRSKILLAGEDWHHHLDTLVDSIGDEGGTACVNATAVLTDTDPTGLADVLAERLGAIPSLPPEDDRAVLPCQPSDQAARLERYLLDHAAGTTPHLGGDGITDPVPGGGAALRPAVFEVDRPDATQTGIELGFPCVWVAPWSPADGTGPLRDSLVLTALTHDEALVDRLVDDPTIRNVYVGDHPTYWMRSDTPHDGYLGEFLMRTKTVLRG